MCTLIIVLFITIISLGFESVFFSIERDKFKDTNDSFIKNAYARNNITLVWDGLSFKGLCFGESDKPLRFTQILAAFTRTIEVK